MRSGLVTAALATALAAALCLSSSPPAGGSPDLLLQEGFESGLSGWAAVGGDLTTTSAFARTGERSAMLTVEDNAVIQSHPIAVRPEADYVLSAFLLNNDSRVQSVRVETDWEDSSQTKISFDHTTSTARSSTWTQIVVNGRSPEGAALAAVKITVISDAGGVIYLDDVSIEGPAPLPPTPTLAPSDTALPAPSSTSVATPSRTPSATPSAVPSPTPLPTVAASLTNGGFEDATDGIPSGWQKYGGDLKQTSMQHRSGQYSGEFVSVTDSTKWAFEEIAVSGDTAYQFDAYVLLNDPAVKEVFLRVSWYTSDDTSGSAIAVSDSPQRLSGNGPAFRYISAGPALVPPAARSARFRVMLAPASAAPATVYIDDASLQQVSPELAATPVPPPLTEQVVLDDDIAANEQPTRSAHSLAPAIAVGLPHQGESPYALKINEVMYDPPQPDDAAYEWLELYNAGDQAVDLAGWTVSDNAATNPLSSLVLAPHRFVVVAAGGFREAYPDFTGAVVTIASGRIGNGLANKGDRLLIYDASGKLADAVSWGDDTGVLSPSAALVATGHSIERSPAGRDSDAASDFTDNAAPSPGRAFGEKAVAAAAIQRQAAGSSTISPPESAKQGASNNLKQRLLVSFAAGIVSLAAGLSIGSYGSRRFRQRL